ncbi:MAG TPA: hypothetical protein VLS49_07070 [Usitatibacter sp.]|nr:hypothetical protein [Usitatibacter sp.]
MAIPGRAETAAARRAIVARILAAWERAPELRLGQLLVNVVASRSASHNGDPYFIEDADLAAACEAWVAERGG